MTAERDTARPTVREVAELLARVRRLAELGADADAAERAAVLEEKRDILRRIEEGTGQ